MKESITYRFKSDKLKDNISLFRILKLFKTHYNSLQPEFHYYCMKKDTAEVQLFGDRNMHDLFENFTRNQLGSMVMEKQRNKEKCQLMFRILDTDLEKIVTNNLNDNYINFLVNDCLLEFDFLSEMIDYKYDKDNNIIAVNFERPIDRNKAIMEYEKKINESKQLKIELVDFNRDIIDIIGYSNQMIITRTTRKRIEYFRFKDFFWVDDPISGITKNVYNWNDNATAKVSRDYLTPIKNIQSYERGNDPIMKYAVMGAIQTPKTLDKCVFFKLNFDGSTVQFQKFSVVNHIVKFSGQVNKISGDEKNKFLKSTDYDLKISWTFRNEVNIYPLRRLLLHFANMKIGKLLYMDFERMLQFDYLKSFELCKQALSEWLTILLKVNSITNCPISKLWNSKTPHVLAFDYLKYRYCKRANMIIPTITKKTDFQRTKIERFQITPPKGTVISNKLMTMYDFTSFYPNVIIGLCKDSKIKSQIIHRNVLSDLFKKRIESDDRLNIKTYKLLLNAGGFGKFGADEFPGYSVFPSNKEFMVKIVNTAREKIEQVIRLHNLRVIYGLTDSFLIDGTRELDVPNLKYEGCYRYAFFFNCNTYILYNNDNDMIRKGPIFNSFKYPKVIRDFYLLMVKEFMLHGRSRMSLKEFLEIFNNYMETCEITWDNFFYVFKTSILIHIEDSQKSIPLSKAIKGNHRICVSKTFMYHKSEILKWFSSNIMQ